MQERGNVQRRNQDLLLPDRHPWKILPQERRTNSGFPAAPRDDRAPPDSPLQAALHQRGRLHGQEEQVQVPPRIQGQVLSKTQVQGWVPERNMRRARQVRVLPGIHRSSLPESPLLPCLLEWWQVSEREPVPVQEGVHRTVLRAQKSPKVKEEKESAEDAAVVMINRLKSRPNSNSTHCEQSAPTFSSITYAQNHHLHSIAYIWLFTPSQLTKMQKKDANWGQVAKKVTLAQND